MTLKDKPGDWIADLGCGVAVALVIVTMAVSMVASCWKEILK